MRQNSSPSGARRLPLRTRAGPLADCTLHRPRRTVDLAFILSQFGVASTFSRGHWAPAHRALTRPSISRRWTRTRSASTVYSTRRRAQHRHPAALDVPGRDQGSCSRTTSSSWRGRPAVAVPRVDVDCIVDRPVYSYCFAGGGYVGHYVLITGFDDARQGYVIKDPGGAGRAWWIATTSTPPAARTAPTRISSSFRGRSRK